jgi:hypothetical protein
MSEKQRSEGTIFIKRGIIVIAGCDVGATGGAAKIGATVVLIITWISMSKVNSGNKIKI